MQMLIFITNLVLLPLTNPIQRFLLILVVILAAPLILNKLKIPHLLGLIIAGAIIGPNGFNLLERDSGIILSGTAGLLYIMFLAGLDIDLADFKRNRTKSIVFGLYTFIIPMLLGIVSSIYILKFSLLTSVLLASMFASHTLIAYPIISKFGVTKNIAVNITVGGTLITDTLALLVLAVIVGITKGEVGSLFYMKLTISIMIFGMIILFLIPILARWFFKNFFDSISQYIFVLTIVFLSAVLAEIAGVEGIIGAFLAGISLNRLIPRTSPLMNRVEFVGHAIFIPFFLIGVGMLIDYHAFISGWDAIKVAIVMVVVATLAKFLAAYFTQKTFNFTIDERRIIFGLSNAQAAATLAAVLIGFNIIIGETDSGEPIRLLGESILNGTVIMILVTCTTAAFITQKGAKNIALQEVTERVDGDEDQAERILVPISHAETSDELINLGITLRSKTNIEGITALSVIKSDLQNNSEEDRAKRILTRAAVNGAASDTKVHQLLRYDLNLINGITNVVKEQKITDLILGLHIKKQISDSFLGKLSEGVLSNCNISTYIYRPKQPFNTIKRHLIVVPPRGEQEIGFPYWLHKVFNMKKNSGGKLIFYATSESLDALKRICSQIDFEAQFESYLNWQDFTGLAKNIQKDDNLIVVMSQRYKLSYQSSMASIHSFLNEQVRDNSFILIYPIQEMTGPSINENYSNWISLEPFVRMDLIGKTLKRLFNFK